jgi:sigma-B regulation protein RsbU (phosphoserine phosphatase)
VVKFVRANPATRDTPMIVLPGKPGPAVQARAFAPGASDYLVKLPGPIELVARARYPSWAYLNRLERDEAYRWPRRSPGRPATSGRSCPSGSRGA